MRAFARGRKSMAVILYRGCAIVRLHAGLRYGPMQKSEPWVGVDLQLLQLTENLARCLLLQEKDVRPVIFRTTAQELTRKRNSGLPLGAANQM